ncbi:MAG: radical SAM protein [Planctomycetaceae bacterium]|nr:radical SAM protein [Planctomycetaceae bacterium]
MLFRFLYRVTSEVSWRLLFKAAYLWCGKGFFALRAFKKRDKKGIQFPPFLFFSLTNRCNLRCRGCWVETPTTQSPALELSGESIEKVIRIAQKESVYFYTMLGGEPFLAPETLWGTIKNHPEAYFQIITNGLFFDEVTVRQIKQFGNISPLVSIDGFEKENDNRRGQGTFTKAIEGCKELQRQRILYGVATTVTAENFERVLTEEYVNHFVKLGAMYLWFYVYRPVSADPVPEWSVGPERLLELRRRLLRLRRKSPIILIDTYWDEKGYAVCPASKGMAFVIGPKGSIEPCPPLNVTREWISDNDGDFYKTMNDSEFLLRFREFVGQKYDGERSQGCVIIDYPQELAEFFRSEGVTDVSGRDFLAELSRRQPLASHYLPGQEIPEDYWVYRILKKTLFFGMGAYG